MTAIMTLERRPTAWPDESDGGFDARWKCSCGRGGRAWRPDGRGAERAWRWHVVRRHGGTPPQ